MFQIICICPRNAASHDFSGFWAETRSANVEQNPSRSIRNWKSSARSGSIGPRNCNHRQGYGVPYDFGPGVVRRAEAAAVSRGIKALEPTRLRVAFVTHLHSDHTVEDPDLIFTPWTVGRRVPLEVYGPTGLKAMTEHILEAYRVDIETRTNPDGNQRTFPGGYKVDAHEIKTGVVYKDENVTEGFRHEARDGKLRLPLRHAGPQIVISGDTNPTQATIEACYGCDVLIHEAHTPAWLATRPESFQKFAAKYHTTTLELAELARQAKPRLLILYHYSSLSPEELFDDMLAHYPGHFVIGRDLDVY